MSLTLISKNTIMKLFGLSRGTMYRVLRKARLEVKNLYSIEEIEIMLPHINTIESIYEIDDRVGIRLTNGQDVILEGETGRQLSQIVSNFIKKWNKMRQSETTKNDLVPVITNLTQQVTLLAETIKDLVMRVIKIENVLYKPSSNTNITQTQKALWLAIDDYIRMRNLIWTNKNDVFIELLDEYERVKGVEVRKQYNKEDRAYINTLVRLGLAEDFINFVKNKC